MLFITIKSSYSYYDIEIFVIFQNDKNTKEENNKQQEASVALVSLASIIQLQNQMHNQHYTSSHKTHHPMPERHYICYRQLNLYRYWYNEEGARGGGGGLQLQGHAWETQRFRSLFKGFSNEVLNHRLSRL
jgi:hypothetical protein